MLYNYSVVVVDPCSHVQAAHRLPITTRQNDKADSHCSWMASNLPFFHTSFVQR